MNIHRLYAPFQNYFRTRRMRHFEAMFEPTRETRIVDVGGYKYNWTLIDSTPQVLLVNLEDETCRDGRFLKVRGDGRQLSYDDNSFDIAYSNSVIEHVGDTHDQEAFASEIRRVAPRYYLQTPNRWFLIEPHLITAGIHLLPRRLMRRLVRWLSVWGWVEKPDQAKIDEFIASIRLLDHKLDAGAIPRRRDSCREGSRYDEVVDRNPEMKPCPPIPPHRIRPATDTAARPARADHQCGRSRTAAAAHAP